MLLNLLLTIAGKGAEKAAGIPTVELSQATEENYYAIARLTMRCVEWLLNLIGEGDNQKLFIWVYSLVVFGLSVLIGEVVKWIIIGITRIIGKRLDTDIYKRLRAHRIFIKASRIVTPLVFIILIQFTLNSQQSLSEWLTRLSWVYISFVVAYTLCGVVSVTWEHIDARENVRKLPLNGLAQLVKGLIWIIGAIVIVSILLSKSPASLLAGLGAFAAVLMLVFKDSILGVVAGVQLSENDSLHVGDWIKVHGTDANGTVTQVTLNAVKVLNWDKTTTYIPPYSLISGSFTNYRSMQDSNSRQIQRSYMIDADSVVPTDDAMLQKYAEIPLLKNWIATKIAQRDSGKVEDVNNSAGLADGSLETNLGVFRAYVRMYLDSHPCIDHSGGISYCFVSTLAQTSAGIPFQLYCFTNTSAWLSYEAIQSSIFEHLAVMLAKFNLYTFENPSGRDTIIDGYLSPGKNPENIFGLPYPLFDNGGTPQSPADIGSTPKSPTPQGGQSESPAVG